MLVLSCLCITILLATIYIGTVALKLRRLTSQSCSALLQSMRYVDMAEICCVARQVRSEDPNISIEHAVQRLGGLEGLLRLYHNAGAMLDIARYLLLVKPDASALAHIIRQDAARVRRTALVLYLQHKLRVNIRGPIAVRDCAKLYVSVSVNTMRLCGCLADDILPLLQQMSSIQAGMIRANTASISGTL